jgi:hypothetical protein
MSPYALPVSVDDLTLPWRGRGRACQPASIGQFNRICPLAAMAEDRYALAIADAFRATALGSPQLRESLETEERACTLVSSIIFFRIACPRL